MKRKPLAEGEIELDDIWANEGGVSVRVVRVPGRGLRIEFTSGVNEGATAQATLTGYRAIRLAGVLRREFLEEGTDGRG